MKHRSSVETEVKLRIPSTASQRPMLAALGFSLAVPAQAERSVLWDRPAPEGGELLARGSALRVRSYAGRTILTFKGPKVPDPEFKVRPEHETDVADPEALEAILRSLGYAPVLEMVKVREIWSREELEACLDETPFGCFLELEGDPQAIRYAMEGLALDKGRIEPRSYPTLFREHAGRN